jgi:hypothetical protein
MKRNHLKELGVDGNLLKLILQKQDVDWSRLPFKQGPMAGFCEHGNEISSTIKGATRCVHEDRHSEVSFKMLSQSLNSEITRQTSAVADLI